VAITGVTEEQYRHYVAHGGKLRFEMEARDLDPSGSFEKSPFLAPYLESGFELKPSPVIEMPQNSAALFLYGDSWDLVIAHTYLNGGSIVYKKLASGRYEALAEVPVR
jgi:hypothetical protein